MIEASLPNVRAQDLPKLFGLSNQEELNALFALLDRLYQAGEINWRVVDGNSVQHRAASAFTLNEHEIIKDTIGLLRDFEKII